MKRLYVPIIIIVILLFCGGNGFASTSLYNETNNNLNPYYTGANDAAPYSWIYQGSGIEDFSDNSNWMVNNLELAFLLKWEEDGTWKESTDNTLNSSDFTITPIDIDTNDADTEYHKGSWEYTGDSNLASEPFYFSIKAGSGSSGGGYNLFQMNDGWDQNQTVYWSTLDAFFDQTEDDFAQDPDPAISHVAFWVKTDAGNPVPEPATFFFLGIGLLVLGFVGRRKFSGLEAD